MPNDTRSGLKISGNKISHPTGEKTICPLHNDAENHRTRKLMCLRKLLVGGNATGKQQRDE